LQHVFYYKKQKNNVTTIDLIYNRDKKKIKLKGGKTFSHLITIPTLLKRRNTYMYLSRVRS